MSVRLAVHHRIENVKEKFRGKLDASSDKDCTGKREIGNTDAGNGRSEHDVYGRRGIGAARAIESGGIADTTWRDSIG
jgi:hypothetical protein